MSPSFRVATFNTNSVRVRLDQIVAWLQRETPDVLALQETKAQDIDFPMQAFRSVGYHVVYRGQKAHAGVAMLSREEPRDVRFGLDDGGDPDEPRLVQASVAGIPIVNTYVPQGNAPDAPQFAYKLRWFARLKGYFERHFAAGQPLLWVGDLNVAPEPIDIYDPVGLADNVDFHPLARAALKDVTDWGLVDVVRRLHPDEPEIYTYWDYRMRNAVQRKAGWRVDHIMATEPLARRATRCWVDVQARLVERPSDHTFLVAEFEL